MTYCPSSEKLACLMADQMGGAEAVAVEAHIEACSDCQQALERLTGRADTPVGARPGGTDFKSVLQSGESGRDFLRRLEQQPPTGALLSLDQDAQATPTAPPHGQAMPAGPEPLPTIAGYELLSELGRGGMGAVYKARQLGLHRALAVKVLLAKHRDQHELRQRFLEEAQVMAELQHPGIAPIHEIGTLADGRPFFSMKQVRGQTLAEILKLAESGVASAPRGETTRGALTQPRSPAELPRLLSIFEQVSQTVAYAHAQGILHRDLKPANIMVGAFGEVQLMDWGLAKVLSTKSEVPNPKSVSANPAASDFGFRVSDFEPAETAAGRVLGTAAYMAPEQARGEVDELDERCDVFGLGAILCEILTGQPPFSGDSQIDNRRRAAQAELVDAFTRLDQSGAEEELISLAKKCLAAEKAQRPRHAGTVAEELAAHQARVRERLRRAEIERAQAQARAEEERKRREAEQAKAAAERKRRQATVILATVAAVFVLAVAGAGVWYYQDRAALADEATERAKNETQRKSNEAEQKATEVAHHKAVGQQVSAALTETEQLRQKLHKKLGDPLEVAALLSDPELWNVHLEKTGAASQRAAELAASAARPLEEGIAGRLATVGKQVQADNEDFKVAKDLDNIRLLAAVRWEGENVAAVKKMVCDKSAKVFKKLGYDIRQGDMKKMAAQMGQSPLRFVLVAALDYWAEMADDRNDLSRLLPLARQLDPDPWRDRLRVEKAWFDPNALLKLAAEVDPAQQSPQIIGALASGLHGFREMEAATKLLRKALIYHPQDFWLHFNLGFYLTDPVEQAACYRAALAIRPNSSTAHNNLAIALHDLKDLDGAIAHYEKATASANKHAEAHNNWGTVLVEINDLDGAAAKYQKALEINANFPMAYSNLGNVLKRYGDLGGAILHYRKALDLFPQWSSGLTPEYKQKFLASIHCNLGLALNDVNKYDEAIDHHKEALNNKSDLVTAYGGLAEALLHQGKFAEAIEAYEQFLQQAPPNHYFRAVAQNQLDNCKRLLAADKILSDVLQGKIRQLKPSEFVKLAYMCRTYKHQYAAAAKFYADAFAGGASLAGHQYLAARAAALAGTGKGKDAANLDEAAKAKLRQQALKWLQDDLAGRPQFHSGPVKSALALAKTMPAWQSEPDLAGVRDEQSLAKLPEKERDPWRKLWAEVAASLKQAQASFTETKLQGKLTAKERKQVHLVELAAGKTYVIELTMKQAKSNPQFENNLRLEDAEGKLLADDTNSGSNGNARIIFTPTHDGTYHLVATSLPQEGTGPYTLTIWQFTGK